MLKIIMHTGRETGGRESCCEKVLSNKNILNDFIETLTILHIIFQMKNPAFLMTQHRKKRPGLLYLSLENWSIVV